MKPPQKRNKLFEVFSENLTLIRPLLPFVLDDLQDPKFQEAVMCPICMTLFNRNALNQNLENPLTIEHCPAEELGGKPLILLCKKCNNSAGYELDIKLIEHLNGQPFIQQQAQGRVFLSNTIFEGDSLQVRGTMELKRLDSNSFYIDLKATDSYRKNRFGNILKAKEIQISYKPHEGPSVHLVHTALLRIAYLLAFSKFGHPFILNGSYESVRRQIADPSRVVLPSKGVILKTSLPVGFHLITSPKYLVGIAVVFVLAHENQCETNAVILNHPDASDVDFYAELKRHESETCQIQAQKIEDLDYLNSLEDFHIYLEKICSASPTPSNN